MMVVKGWEEGEVTGEGCVYVEEGGASVSSTDAKNHIMADRWWFEKFWRAQMTWVLRSS